MSSEEHEEIRALKQRAAVNADTIKKLMEQVASLQELNTMLVEILKEISEVIAKAEGKG